MHYLKSALPESAKKPTQYAGASAVSECQPVPGFGRLQLSLPHPTIIFDKEAVATKIVQPPGVSLISSLGRRQRKIQINEGEAGKLWCSWVHLAA